MMLTKPRQVALGALIIALGLVAASWAGGAYGYSFPRVVSLIVLTLAVVLLAVEILAPGQAEEGAISIPWGSIIPALAIFFLLLLALRILGFYVTTLLGFVVISSVYMPGLSSSRKILLNIVIGTGFLAVLFGVFTALLKVQFPKGLLL